jgi:aminoglycoside phosphotransferase (APT) family kinase protein
LTLPLADRLSHYLSSRYPDAAVSEVNFLVSGFESEIYTSHLTHVSASGDGYILRLFLGDGAAEKLAREAKALSLLRNAGYPVPALLLQEIIERLEGQALWPVLASAKPQHQSQLLSKFGSLLAQLHQLDWRLFTENPEAYEENPARLLDETISHYRSLYRRDNLRGFIQITDWLDRHKHAISVRPAAVHQDFHANNVFLGSDGKFSVIDWTQFAVSDYRIDLAWTLLIMRDFGNATWGQPIWNAYASHSNLPIEHLDYFDVIVSMKLLASTVLSFVHRPAELGLRPEAVQLTKEHLSIYKQISQRIRTITGLTIPELENVLERM